MGKYRPRPIVIEAEQWIPGQNDEVVECNGMINRGDQDTDVQDGEFSYRVPAGHGMVPTLEGNHIVTPLDWIITGVAGERYPCKPDIFAASYEEV